MSNPQRLNKILRIAAIANNSKIIVYFDSHVFIFQELKESKAKIFRLENDLSFQRSLEKENAVLKSQVSARNCNRN